MNKITQDMRFKQVVIEHSFKYGVTKAAIRYKTSRQNIIIENTTSFKTFADAYREELKAGKMPGENLLIAMTNAVETLDQEYEKFLAKKPKQKQQNRLTSLRDCDPFWR